MIVFTGSNSSTLPRFAAAVQSLGRAAVAKRAATLFGRAWSKRIEPSAESPTFYFFCRLLPPRPSFAVSMTPDERKIMEEHDAYWRSHARAGRLVIFGRVDDPAGTWRLLILRLASACEAEQLVVMDPAIKRRIGMTYDIRAMIRTAEGACP
ncbi:MAG TPA: YciI family protein [Sphingomicrobium sp.]|nr:YciI family protein [Sphingomicrobium sp.]